MYVERYTTDMSRTASKDVEGALLAAAEQILIEEGPSALTVRKVATCAGIAPMGVYSRFEGKQGLLEALFVRGFEGLQRTVAKASGADARERLRDAALRYRRYAVENPQHYALMFERMHEVQPSESAVGRAFASFDQLVRLIADVRSGGAFGVGSDVEVAQQWWSALHGAVALELLGVRFDAEPEQTFGHMIDALLLGLETQGGAG
jgi:AcrR family transcriptional regulator